MSFTFDSLKRAIQDYTENSETTFVNNLPIFIRAAEERILKNVQLNLFMRNQQGVMTTGNKFLGAVAKRKEETSILVELILPFAQIIGFVNLLSIDQPEASGILKRWPRLEESS